MTFNPYAPLPREYHSFKLNPKEIADSLVIAYFGQSNSANSVSPANSFAPLIPNNLIQFDWRSRLFFNYREPLLGADGVLGNTFTPAGIQLAKQLNKRIIIVPFGVGGSSVIDWAYGYLSFQFDLILYTLLTRYLSPQFFLWHQGESDTLFAGSRISELRHSPPCLNYKRQGFSLGTSKMNYKHSLSRIMDKIYYYFPQSKFGIALASRVDKDHISEDIRQAQCELIAEKENAFFTGDSDKINSSKTRYDQLHFTPYGAELLSLMYLENLYLHIK